MQITKKFDFTNNEGIKLSGRLEMPAQKPRAYALYAHCFTCSKNVLAATKISKKLSENGIAVLRFDFTGLGNSEGDFGNTNFSSNLDDLKAAYAAIENEFEAPQLLIGHSLGGAAVLALANEFDGVKAIATLGAPSDVEHVSHLFQSEREEIERDGEAKVQLAGREFCIKKQFIEDISEQNILENLKKAKKAFLIMHSPIDDTVSIDHAGKIYDALKHPKSFVTLDNADHLLMNPADAEYASQMIYAWIDRYIDKKENHLERPKEGVVVINREGHKFTNDIYSKTNHFVADEPRSLKGDDLGMNPYEILLSSLGACTSMTMRMYADRKGFDLKDIKVNLTHEKVQLDEKSWQDVIHKHIEIAGNLSDEEKQKVLEIAERCPVNKTLQSDIKIVKD